MPATTDLFDCRSYNGTTYTRLTVHDLAAHLAAGRLRMDDFVRVHNATTTPWVRLHHWFTPPDPAPPIDLNPGFSTAFDRAYPEFQSLASNLGHFGHQAWRAVTAGVRWAGRGPILIAVLIICATILLAPHLSPRIDSSAQRAEIQRIIYQTSNAGIVVPNSWRWQNPAIKQPRISVENFIILNESWLRRTRNTKRFASIVEDLRYVEDSIKFIALMAADKDHRQQLKLRPQSTSLPEDHYTKLMAQFFISYPIWERESHRRDLLYPMVQVRFQTAMQDLVAALNDIDER